MVFVLLFYIFSAIIIGVYACVKNNYKKHIYYLFFTIVIVFYAIYAPLVNILEEDYHSFNVNIQYDGFVRGLAVLFTHILFINVGYFSKLFKIRQSWYSKPVVFFDKRIGFLFGFLFVLICINAAFGQVSLFAILRGKVDVPTLGFEGKTYWIANLADSLIILLIAMFFYNKSLKMRVTSLALAIPLFLILGFRYRLLLLIFGMFFLFLHKTKINIIKASKILGVFIVTFLFFMFVSENRIQLYSMKYDDINYDVTSFNYNSIYENSLGSIVDFGVYDGLHKGKIESDFGETMFKYPFIIIMPASFFERGVKPYPPPQIKAIDKALNVPRSYGQAVTFIGMSYYAFSLVGVILFSFFLGKLLRVLELTNYPDPYFLVKTAVVLSLFQLYTRGYIGQFLQHLAYLYIPVYLLRRRFGKKTLHVRSPDN